jgi:hypothetical protein
MIDLEISLVIHRYESAALEVRITESPAQNVVGPLAEMFTIGRGFTVTDSAAEVLEQPLLSVAVTA